MKAIISMIIVIAFCIINILFGIFKGKMLLNPSPVDKHKNPKRFKFAMNIWTVVLILAVILIFVFQQ